MGVKLSLKLREEHRLVEFGNRMLSGIFGLKRDEVIGCRKWHNEKFHSLYSLPSIIRMKSSVRGVGHVARMGAVNAYGIFVGKPDGKRTLGRPIHGLVDSLKMDVRLGWSGLIWLKIFQQINFVSTSDLFKAF
jgi:hypothetical protein